MEDKYFMIYNYDGDTKVREYTKKQLEQELEKEEFYNSNKNFLTKISDPDTNYWGENPIIIKGQIVVPKIIEKVTKYEL
jgi:hypothetical protein